MSGKGFSKAAQALPVKAKRKKPKDKLQSYTLCHFGRDGVSRILKLKAKSQKEALRKFNIFVDVLDLCLSEASDEEILSFMEANPIDTGAKPSMSKVTGTKLSGLAKGGGN